MFKVALLSLILLVGSFSHTQAARKCLKSNFETDSTEDGLKNCRCANGFEFDEIFGNCFKNRCKEHCNEMDCAIRKPIQNEKGFDYYCTCPQGFQSLSPHYKLRCVPFESMPGNEYVARDLPKNPLLMQKLNCSQTYEVVGNEYKCKCFDGYELNEKTGDCVLKKKCMRRCGPNAVCTVDQQNNTHCTCKTGFSGKECEENFCDVSHMKTVTKDQKTYLQLATLNVCGTKMCELNANNQFRCACPFGMERTDDGFCRVIKPCLPNRVGYLACEKERNTLCSVRIDEADLYKCRCEMSIGYNLQRTCNNYTSRYSKSNNVTHNLKMQIRLDLEKGETFNTLFNNQMFNLLTVGFDRRLPDYAIQEFIDYEHGVFRSYETVEFYKPIFEDKLRGIFLKGLNNFEHLQNCHIYPELSFNRDTFKPTRLVETIFTVNYEITCKNSMDKNVLMHKFVNEHLIQDYVENYFYLKNTGYVLPESIKIN